MTVAESAPQADTRSVCVIRTAFDINISTDTERRAGLSAVAEPVTSTYVSFALKIITVQLRLADANG